jgi:hypothetical protein
MVAIHRAPRWGLTKRTAFHAFPGMTNSERPAPALKGRSNKAPFSTLLLPFVLLLCVGCNSTPETTSISGKVSLGGRPLQEGYITFYPEKGTETTIGAKVVEGHYQIDAITPGKWRVLISGTPEVKTVQHKNGVTTLKLESSPNMVSPKAKGNLQVIEVHSGVQALDFTLQNPVTSGLR